MKFLLDANFLVYCAKQKIDLIGELSRFGKPELFVLNSIIRELETISQEKGESGAAARIVTDFVKSSAKTINSRMEPDKAIASKSREYVICTNDKDLIKRIKKKQGKAVCVRSKRLLMML